MADRHTTTALSAPFSSAFVTSFKPTTNCERFSAIVEVSAFSTAGGDDSCSAEVGSPVPSPVSRHCLFATGTTSSAESFSSVVFLLLRLLLCGFVVATFTPSSDLQKGGKSVSVCSKAVQQRCILH